MLVNNQLSNSDIYTEIDDPLHFDSLGNQMPGSETLWQDSSQWKKINFSPSLEQDDFSHLDKLLFLLNQPSDQVFKDQIGEVLDLDYFFRWQAHATLLGSFHQGNEHNQILYLNPQNNKFQIIPKEIAMTSNKLLTDQHNQLVDRILSIKEFRDKRDKVLANYLTNQNLIDDLAYFKDLFNHYRSSFYLDNNKFLSNWGFDQTTFRQQKEYQQRFLALRSTLNKTNHINSFRLVFTGHLYPQFIKLDKIINQINDLYPDVIVLGGDLIPDPYLFNSKEKLWSKFISQMSYLNTTTHLVPGNHDSLFYQYFPELPYSRVIGSNLLIFLDTNSENYPQAFNLSTETISFVKQQLDGHSGKVFIFLHHQIWAKDQKLSATNAFYKAENWGEIHNLLKNKEAYILAGDGHDFQQQKIDNVQYLVSGLPNIFSNDFSQLTVIDITSQSVNIKPHQLNQPSLFSKLKNIMIQ